MSILSISLVRRKGQGRRRGGEEDRESELRRRGGWERRGKKEITGFHLNSSNTHTIHMVLLRLAGLKL